MRYHHMRARDVGWGALRAALASGLLTVLAVAPLYGARPSAGVGRRSVTPVARLGQQRRAARLTHGRRSGGSLTDTVTVPGTANIFGAGHAVPPDPGGYHVNPAHGGGTLPPAVALPVGAQRVLTVSATGAVSCDPSAALNGPDGGCGGSTDISSYGGIAGIIDGQSAFFLMGVFLGPAEPHDPAPSRLDFSTGALGQDFARLAPAIGQSFFIGDGLTGTGTGARQQFVVPAGATRLFLGFADTVGFHGPPGWYDDNRGQLRVTVRVQTGPPGGGAGSTGGGAGPAVSCVTIPPAERSNFQASYAGWRVTGSVSARAGLTVNDVTLLKTAGMAHDREMAYRISVPYVDVQLKGGILGALTSLRHFHLEPDGAQYAGGAFVARTELLIPPRVCKAPADPHEPAYNAQTHPYFPLQPIDQLTIEADYRVWFDAHPTPASRYLIVEQLYKFYAPFDENNHEYDLAHGLACEPSQEVGGFISERGMRCARWKPLVFFFYHPAAGSHTALPAITVPYLLNFAPDHQYVQGAVFIHDCDRSELILHAGPVPLPVLNPQCLTGETPKDVTLADNHETVQPAIVDGQPATWDNVHMTAQRHVGAPVRPPGCEECIHIHWRWGTITLGLLPWNDDPRAKLLYGDGKPLLCDDGHVNPTTGCHTDQSVDIALVNDRPGIENVYDFRQTVDGLPHGQVYGDGNLLGPYVSSGRKPNILLWYVATATYENEDVFFAHGGFFDAGTGAS